MYWVVDWVIIIIFFFLITYWMLLVIFDCSNNHDCQITAMGTSCGKRGQYIIKSRYLLNDHLFGKELFIRFTASVFRKLRQFMYLVISLLVLRAGCGIWLYQFLIIANLFYFSFLFLYLYYYIFIYKTYVTLYRYIVCFRRQIPNSAVTIVIKVNKLTLSKAQMHKNG